MFFAGERKKKKKKKEKERKKERKKKEERKRKKERKEGRWAEAMVFTDVFDVTGLHTPEIIQQQKNGT